MRKLSDKGITDTTLAAMKRVNRADFVSEKMKGYTYEDRPLSIGYDVTISQPSLVGRMIDYLEIDDTNVVLELGTGSAYNAAILSELLRYGTLVTVERVKPLADSAKRRFRGKDNVRVIHDDATRVKLPFGFDRIIVTAEFLSEDAFDTFFENNSNIFCIAVYPLNGVLYRKIRCREKTSTERFMNVRFVPVLSSKRDG